MEDKKSIYYKYFENVISPYIISYEKYRVKTLLKMVLTSIIMFVLGILSAVLFIYIANKNNLGLLILPFLLFFMYVFFIKSIINIIWTGKNYQRFLVEKILPYFHEPVANFKKWLNSDTVSIIDSKLFPNFDDHENIKSIFGIYKNTNIIISDTRLRLAGVIKNDMFKGTLIQLELPKSIENHIVMISKNEQKFNKLKQYNPNIKELNKNLYVFAQNKNNLEFINKEFWSVIERFSKPYTAKSFKFSFNNNILIIAIKQKNPWQFGSILKSLKKSKNYDELIERFTVIYDLIDLLS